MRAGDVKQSRSSASLATTLVEDSLILERFERNVVKRFTPVGIISSHYGTLAWQVGAMGEVKWIVSKAAPLLRRPGDPPWSTTYSAINLESVEVVILEGSLIDLPPHDFLNDLVVKVVVMVVTPPRR